MKKYFLSFRPITLLFFALAIPLLNSCTEDDESENLYPAVAAGFTHTFDNLTRTVTFTNTSEGGATYFWNFGDSQTSTEESPVHTYTADGNFTVTLTVKNIIGTEKTYTKVIPVVGYFPITLPINFESSSIIYSFTNFGGSVSEKVANPHKTGINTTDNVGKTQKNTGAETWAGSFLTLDNPINFGTNNSFKIKVYSPKANAVVRLKIENATNTGQFFETDATATLANQWQELTFNCSAANFANSYHKIVLFFDFGVAGDNSTYYFDDIALTYVTPPPTIDYEQNFENFTLTWTDFGNATTTVLNNPVSGGINTSAKVAKQVKNNGAETWAGSFYQVATALPLTQASVIKMKVYAPQAGLTVRLKVENATTQSQFYEVDATTTVANQWETLTFTCNTLNAANSYHKLVLFMNFGTAGNGATYYFDDITIE